MTKTLFVIFKSKATGRLYQMKEDRISFDSEVYEEYETREEAEKAFSKCHAEQGIEGKDITGGTLYYAEYYTLVEDELHDGTCVDEKYIMSNGDDLDFEWNGYEED